MKKNKRKSTKGHYGYLRARKKGLLIRGFILLAGIISLLVTGIVQFKTRNNLLTVVAVVSTLPMAMQFATYFTIFKYHSRPEEEYNRVRGIVGNGLLNTELLMASKTAKTLEVAYAYIHESGIYFYCENPRIPLPDAEAHIKLYLKNNNVDTHIKIFTELGKFEKRLKELTTEDRSTCDDLLLRQEGVIRAISM